MLRFLTHKLKSQSLNEDQQEEFENKAQDDHDSGTESDDESGDTNGFPGDNNVMEHDEEGVWGTGIYQLPGRGSVHCNEEVGPGAGEMMMMMGGGGGGGRDSASSQFECGYNDSALPSDSDHAYDHHSSEEELEVINSTSYDEVDDEVNLVDGEDLLNDADESSLPGGGRGSSENCKRKWSQMASNRLSVESTSSSDDEVQGLLRPLSTPVEFRTSPPVDAHKPSRSQSPPPKLFLFSGPTTPIVTSTTASLLGDEGISSGGAGPVCPDGSAAVGPTSPISSNVVSSSITTSSVPGVLTMAGRNTGVFRGIRRYTDYTNSDGYPPFSIISSTSLLITNNSTGGSEGGGESGGLAMERSDGLLSARSHLTLTNSNETPSTFTNLLASATSPTNNSSLLSTSTTTGAFGKVTSRSGGTGGGGTKESTRKRHRHHNPRHIHRPYLDFEKMQQLKARSVTTWRSGGELSLYCS